MRAEYQTFLSGRAKWTEDTGVKVENLPDFLYDFQADLVAWALNKGRAAIFADCGMGKTAMQLAWAYEIVKKTNKPVLLLTPLAVGQQTKEEAEKFGIEAARSRDGHVSGAKVWVTNYEQLHKFNPADFGGAVADESSCIKDLKSQTKGAVVEFCRTLPYRLLCTATAAPNDYHELGPSSEALGYLGARDMLTMFFKMEQALDGRGWGRTKFRFRGHSERPFWSWVCSWAKCIRKPSDIGYSDEGFDLPPLKEREYVVQSTKMRDGFLFQMPANNLQEEREDRRNSIPERVERATEIVAGHKGPSVVWCELNAEASALVKAIPNAKQVSGSMDDDEKEEILSAFSHGQLPCLVTKPKIGCWGLNWQHCSNIVMFPSHSFEQYYQAVRRCWRFGQTKEVTVSLILCEGEEGVLKSIKRKSAQADAMFESLRVHMNDPQAIVKVDTFPESERIPAWV
jgi:hypothetical protein